MNNVDFEDLYEQKSDRIVNTHINIGTGKSFSIRELAEIIADIVEYKGKILFDTTKLDNKTDRTLDCSKLFSLGWKPSISLYNGTKELYNYFKKTIM